MLQNNSPWLTQLDTTRAKKSLAQNLDTDIVIVGGGIAGVVTAYFLLTTTNKNIILVEGDTLGHGATGHNAGQVVAEFERNLCDIANEFGETLAIEGQRSVEKAWDLLRDILTTTNIDIPFQEFIGYSGHQTLETLLQELEVEALKARNGLPVEPVYIDEASGWLEVIPSSYVNLCVPVTNAYIQQLLHTTTQEYRAVIGTKKATVNSALFTEKLAQWCLKTFQKRFDVFEKTFVHGIDLSTQKVSIITDQSTTIAEKIILCTNGFENFFIKDAQGFDIDTSFHHNVMGIVGYMTGYVTPQKLVPLANRYFDPTLNYKQQKDGQRYSDTYFYITQRAFGSTETGEHLLALGGPEKHLDEREIYFKHTDVPDTYHDIAVSFIEKNFETRPFSKKFFWHGLMGYTKNGLRSVGPDVRDNRLLYNLGCNGVGILTSIMGGELIARHLSGGSVPKTIFDPQ